MLGFGPQPNLRIASTFVGRIWTYAYSTSGYLSKATYPDATYEEYTYDSAGRMLTVRDRRGNTMVTNEYDTRQTLADGGVYTFAYTLDGNGKVIETQVTDPRSHIRRRQFNGAGYLTGLTRALGTPEEQTVTYTRNAANFVTEETDALGRVTEYEYDAKGNRTQLTRLYGTPEAVSWSTTYEPTINQVASITDPLGHTTSAYPVIAIKAIYSAPI